MRTSHHMGAVSVFLMESLIFSWACSFHRNATVSLQGQLRAAAVTCAESCLPVMEAEKWVARTSFALKMGVVAQELHDRLAAESDNPAEYNQISSLIDIAMEFIMPNMELRHGNMLDAAESASFPFSLMTGKLMYFPFSLLTTSAYKCELRIFCPSSESP